MTKSTISLLAVLSFFQVFSLSSCKWGRDGSDYKDILRELESDSTQYDSLLAAELGADKYGMRKYVIAFLKSGPNRDQDSLEVIELQRAHLDNINRLAEAGKLVLAGPFLDDTDLRGIYIFNVETVEEAEKLTNSDPAIRQGRLIMELHPWYSSAAVIKINEIHQRISMEPV